MNASIIVNTYKELSTTICPEGTIALVRCPVDHYWVKKGYKWFNLSEVNDIESIDITEPKKTKECKVIQLFK